MLVDCEGAYSEIREPLQAIPAENQLILHQNCLDDGATASKMVFQDTLFGFLLAGSAFN